MGDLSKHFNRSEFACKCGCGFDTVDYELVNLLEDIREHFGQPVYINSACRCPMHNANEGGASQSQHLKGRAADISVKDVDPSVVAGYVELNGIVGGIGIYNSFTHIDTRSGFPARWSGA
jgi:uncharacterized protein YcbK (DUF882 family)